MKTAYLKTLCFTLAVLCLFALLTGCGKQVGGDSFGFALHGTPKQIDPQAASDTPSLTVIAHAFEGLTRIDQNGNAVPAAADYTVSDDGLVYTFILKESYWSTVAVKGKETGFEDPVQVTAEDFVFGIRRGADPSTASPYAKELLPIKNAGAVLAGECPVNDLGVKAVDNRTLVIELSAPDPTFLQKLATPVFMPCNRVFFGYTQGRYGLEKQYVLTNGGFYVSDWKDGKSITLKKNEHYHGAKDILPLSVQYRVTVSAEEDKELLSKGYLDGAPLPSGDETDFEQELQTVALQDTLRFLWFNTEITPFSDGDIRRAFRDGIQWETLWQELGKGVSPAKNFVPAAAVADGAAYSDALPFQTDPQAAKTALAAGLERLELQKMPRFSILVTEQTANTGRYILQSLSKHLNIHGDLQMVDNETLEARVKAGNYQLAIMEQTGVGFTAKENLSMFLTDGIGNYARFSSAEFDQAYADSGNTAGDVKALEQILFRECPVFPLGNCHRYYYLNKTVQNVTVRPFNGGAYGGLLVLENAYRTDD